MFIVVQAATALILYTGGNTSFNGFPFLASFVAEDAFLPRWLTKRGHRLVFSNGIIVLAVLSCTLLAVAGANVNNLVPFYAIGVFTAFTMAGFGMAKYHHRARESAWRRRLVINFSAGVTSLVVVLIFVVVKFTEGAWLVVILFAIGVPALIRLNREYRAEAGVLEHIGTRHQAARSADLFAPHGVRVRRRLRPGHARRAAVRPQPAADHAARGALRHRQRPGRHAAPGLAAREHRRRARLRRLPGPPAGQGAAEMVSAEAALPGVGVTAILPRRGYSPLLGRLLHDRTADKIAGVVSRIPHAAATIVPFDVRSRVEAIQQRRRGRAPGRSRAAAEPAPAADDGPAGRTAARCPTGRRRAADPGRARPEPMRRAGPADGRRVTTRRHGRAGTGGGRRDSGGRRPVDGTYNRPVPPPGRPRRSAR